MSRPRPFEGRGSLQCTLGPAARRCGMAVETNRVRHDMRENVKPREDPRPNIETKPETLAYSFTAVSL